MKKICIILSLLVILLGNVNAKTSKDIMVKYQYTDLTSEYTKEVIDNKVEYELNEDKIRIDINKNDGNIQAMLFEVLGESLEWLKSKVDISENSNVYYLTVLNDINSTNLLFDISIEEYSGENKSIKIYDQEGNLLDKATNNCYIVVESVDKSITDNTNNVVVYEEDIEKTESKETDFSWIVILIIISALIGYILIVLLKRRKDKENEKKY